MTINVSIKVYKTLTKKEITTKLDKIKEIISKEIVIEHDKAIYYVLSVKDYDTIEEVLDALLQAELFYEFEEVCTDDESNLLELVNNLKTTLQISRRQDRMYVYGIEHYQRQITEQVNALTASITDVHDSLDIIDSNICFDVYGVVEDICDAIERPDILDGRVEQLTIQ